ncbi:prephenate dehydrogenase [Marihabitans asiaticum]|uniref:prephenate dehydrogenase n=1 Tax=Marihabitans asiaticum TaxID=415218 RepID=UPI0011A8FCE1|nr:prephenate dehydrogenase [Marihabitans asiaticum]
MSDLPEVLIIGTGLIGTSLGLALVRAGADPVLTDQSVTAMTLARDLGAGRLGPRPGHEGEGSEPAPDLVVVAAPPDVTPSLVADAIARFPAATVTDVASVKGAIRDDLERLGVPLQRYVGSHPMAGRERSGAVAGRADLFEGRAWVVCADEATEPRSVRLVERVAAAVGSVVVPLSPTEHDEAVAAVSHVPQVAASLVAARLEHLSEDAVGLSGPGVRDVTRIAASDPGLWTQILAGNAGAVSAVLHELRDDLDALITALGELGTGVDADAPGARAVLARVIADGNAGHARVPGKHGAAPTAYTVVSVVVGDRPGELGRLLADMGEAGVNLEEIRLDHGLGLPFGIAEVSVLPGAAGHLRESLTEGGWQLHD